MSEDGRDFFEFAMTLVLMIILIVSFMFLLAKCEETRRAEDKELKAKICKDVSNNYEEFKDCLENGY